MKLDDRHFMTHCLVCKMIICAGCKNTNCKCDVQKIRTPKGEVRKVIQGVSNESHEEMVKAEVIEAKEIPNDAVHATLAVADEEKKSVGKQVIEGLKEVIEKEKYGSKDEMVKDKAKKVKKRKARKKKSD